MSDDAERSTQTCQMRLRGSGLPDLPAMAEHIRTMGFGARLRGVEVTVEGTLFEERERLYVRLAGSGAVLPLGELKHNKVQWDFKAKRAHRRTNQEREAHSRLRREWRTAPRLVTVVGPLVETKKQVILEVREFSWSSSAPALNASDTR